MELQHEISVSQQIPEWVVEDRQAEALSVGPDWAVILPAGLRRDTFLEVLRGALEQLDRRANTGTTH